MALVSQSRATRQWLQKQFQSSGIQIEPAALAKLVTIVETVDNPEALLSLILDEIETSSGERKVNIALIDTVHSQYEGRGNTGNVLEVIDAFHAPFILYDPIRKLFHQSNEPRQLFSDASSKTQLYVDRFLLIQQRLRRHHLFRPHQFSNLNTGAAAAARSQVAELTELKALLGLVGERRYVSGFLTRQDEGRYFIEDLSARLPLDLSIAETSDGMFTENCVVVAEGELTPGGSFRAEAIGLPPAEPRAESLAALQGLDFFGGDPRGWSRTHTSVEDHARWRQDYSQDRVVVLSDVHLDRPEVLDNLHTVFAGFSSVDVTPSTFVLMGNFQSYNANAGSVNFSRLKDHFATLGRIIKQYPILHQRSNFLLVPGPGDVGPGNILPRPPLPHAVAAPLLEALPTSAHLCSNPCRIKHGPAELVLFRANLQRKMRGLCILPPPVEETSTVDGASAALFDHVCATVLQESHVCPVPLEYQPIAWEWDHSLWLYPLPHGLVLADAEQAAKSTFDTCVCLNPGSLLQGTFGAWRPTENEMELCDANHHEGEDGEEEEEDVVVEEEDGEGEGGEVEEDEDDLIISDE